jgi:nicotinate phosphoribosyltransferase
MAGDRITLVDAASAATHADRHSEPLLRCVMRDGQRLTPSPSLDEIRSHSKRELERLPDPLRRLAPSATYPVEIGDDLVRLAAQLDSRTQGD